MTNVPLDYDSRFFRTCFMGDAQVRDSSAVPQNRGGEKEYRVNWKEYHKILKE